MAKETEDKIRVANFERDSAVTTLEEDRILAAMKEKAVRKEAGLRCLLEQPSPSSQQGPYLPQEP